MNGNNQGQAPAGQAVRVQTFFSYPVPSVTLAAGGQDSSTVRIESATDFVWFKSVYFADVDGVTGDQIDADRIIPSIDVQIQVSGADRNLFNGFVPVPSVFGTGRIPFVLPAPMVLLANSEVRFDFQSRESTRDLQLRLALIGLKDYGELQT